MRRAIAGAVVIVATAATYRHFAVAGPRVAYEAFAEEILHRRYEAAATMTEGLTANELASRGSQERIGAGAQMFQTLFPSRFKIESQEERPDGTIRLVAIQTVLFNPVGVESALRPAMYAQMKQRVSLRKVSGTWKVVEFDNAFERIDELRKP